MLSSCTSIDGSHRYFPNGTRLPFTANIDTFEVHVSRGVDLRHTSRVNSPTIAVTSLLILSMVIVTSQ